MFPVKAHDQWRNTNIIISLIARRAAVSAGFRPRRRRRRPAHSISDTRRARPLCLSEQLQFDYCTANSMEGAYLALRRGPCRPDRRPCQAAPGSRAGPLVPTSRRCLAARAGRGCRWVLASRCHRGDPVRLVGQRCSRRRDPDRRAHPAGPPGLASQGVREVLWARLDQGCLQHRER